MKIETKIYNKCGETKIKDDFHKRAISPDGRNTICKKCNSIYAKQKYYDESDPVRKEERRIKHYNAEVERGRHLKKKERFRLYKKSAKERGYPFQISMEQFMLFWKKPCSYCGDEIETIGLDREDNSKGYSIDNIIPCCKHCNRMKSTMGKTEFIERIKKISIFFLH